MRERASPGAAPVEAPAPAIEGECPGCGLPLLAAAASTAPRMPVTIAIIMAAVTVLEMKALMSTETSATAARIRVGCSPIHGTESTR